jgi:hypothetical protein
MHNLKVWMQREKKNQSNFLNWELIVVSLDTSSLCLAKHCYNDARYYHWLSQKKQLKALGFSHD